MKRILLSCDWWRMCRLRSLTVSCFREQYVKFIEYLNTKSTAKIIVTDGFLEASRDLFIEQVAKEKGMSLLNFGDLGEMDEMKAVGLFEHSGVAQHPGDKGMEQIAARILDKIL